jgi:predicted alpha/beta-hydrolase family hydrolase
LPCDESAFFAIPGIGPVLVAGPLVAWIVGALEGALVVGGLSAIGAGLYSIGIPKNSIVEYETALKSDKFLLLAHGTADEVEKAKAIMGAARSAQVAVYPLRQQETVGAGA